MKKNLWLPINLTIIWALMLNTHAVANDITLKYTVTKQLQHLADITIKVNDEYLRTDYALLNNKYTELTIKDKGQYVLDHNKRIAYFIDYKVAYKRAQDALDDMIMHAPGFTKAQIFGMSLDPANDPDDYINYQGKGNNTFIGYKNDEQVITINTVSFPNTYVSEKDYLWFLKRTKDDTHFGKMLVGLLDDELIEVMRKFKYQSDQLPVELVYDNFIINLKSIEVSPLNIQNLAVEGSFAHKDITHEAIQFLENVERFGIQTGDLEPRN